MNLDLVPAGANPPDRAADGWPLTPPLANRFCHLDYTPTVDEWLDGMTTGWGAPPASRAVATDPLRRSASVATVTGFIKTQPNLLHVYPDDAAATSTPWPSRRTWSMLANALAHVREDDTAATQAITFGLVGEGVGFEYLTWRATLLINLPIGAIALGDFIRVELSLISDRVAFERGKTKRAPERERSGAPMLSSRTC